MQHFFDVVLDVVMVFQHVCDGCVQVALATLRESDLLVVVDSVASTEGADKGNELLPRIMQSAEKNVGHDDGTCVDERVAWNAVLYFKLYEGVEGCS